MRQAQSSPPFALPLLAGYRHQDGDEATDANALTKRHLKAAAEALQLALLAFEGARPEDDKHDRLRQVQRVREHLADGLVALAKARVYVPGIRTYDMRVLTAAEPDVFAEAARLHHLVTTLLWQNHAIMPAPPRGEPLSPEDEAQLARLLFELKDSEWVRKIGQAGWWVAAGAALVCVPWLGGSAVVGAAACSVAAMVRSLRNDRRVVARPVALASAGSGALKALPAAARH